MTYALRPRTAPPLAAIPLGKRPRALARPQELVAGSTPRAWYRIENAHGDGNEPARVDIFDAIDSWGPPFGISAESLISDLRAITAPNLHLHVNSPGGDVWDGIAVLNALIQHPAHVTAYVDGLAASIASVIVMGADEVEMGLGSQLMIHDAMTVAIGNAAEMKAAADLLDQVSDNIASVYAYRAGGNAADWRATMQGERWYSAEEAVAAGLATRAVAAERPAEVTDSAQRWVLASYRYAGRDAAPDPLSSVSCTDAGDCIAPPRSDSATTAEPPVQLPDPVFDGPQLLRALREAVKA